MNSSTTKSVSLKSRWSDVRSQISDRYQNGGLTSLQATTLLTELMDSFLLEIVDLAADDLTKDERDTLFSKLVIIAVGGYGRGEMYPFSDVDLLIMYERELDDAAQQFVSHFVSNCWDAGLKLGHATRSISQTVVLMREESQVATALVQTRLIYGDEQLHQKLRARFEGWMQKSQRQFIDACGESRLTEMEESASAVYSLEPDVKRSPGALRDLQMIGWVGFAKYGVSSIDALCEQGAFGPDVADSLKSAQEFFSIIRMDLHIHANRAQDILSRQEQLRLTDQEGIADLAGQRAVERFMQQYFLNADFVSKTTNRFVELNRPSTFQERVSARFYRKIVEEKYVVVGGRLNVPSYELAGLVSSLEEILKAFLVAAKHKVRVSSRLIEAIQKHAPELPRTVSAEESNLFLEILSQFGFLGGTLRDLFECGILELLIPHFSHSRGLLQFNHYHAYTVDEHTLRTLDVLDRLSKTPGPICEQLTHLENKSLLPLALLIHDLGKGFEQDHSELGAVIAKNVGSRLHIDDEAIEQIVLLVREHLSMSLLAFRRDTSDPQVVTGFSQTVLNIDTLRKLYLLTICDIQSVAPGLWDDWKAQLLQELFDRTLLSLSGKYERPHLNLQLSEIRDQVLQIALKSGLTGEQLDVFSFELAQMPEHYMLSVSPESIVRDLQIAITLQGEQVEIANHYDPETNRLEVTIITRQRGLERCFHRLTGVMTALHLSILSADVCTSPTGLICDRFLVEDQDTPQEPTPARLEQINNKLTEAASRPVSFERLFQKHRRFQAAVDIEPISDQESHVTIDNATTDSATIIEVFAHDLPGLLFTLSKAIYDLDLSVVLARITTHVDQVVDVFYVTNLDGKPLADDIACKAIRDRLEHVLREFERFGYRLFIS
ncbi:MAG: [protein-PII] uridylyltransferase [Planctomycetaceae bacterium]|nr:[protein-PII] uridylyltransferase [Planctomycetaceae bacterium]